MATNYNTIVTKVIVNPDGTTSGLRTVEEQVNGFANRMQGAFRAATSNAGQMGSAINSVAAATNALNQSSQNWLGTLTSIGAGFAMGGGIGAGIGTVIALAEHISQARQRTAELSAEMENAINTANTFGLTVKQFGDIKFAGLVEGVNPERLEKLLLAAEEVANDGTKLDKIGLSTAALAGKSQYEQIMLIVDAWKQAINAGGKYKQEVIDQIGKKNFAALNPLIQLGSAGIGKSALENPSLPGFVAEALDKLGDRQTVLAEQKKREEALAIYRANIRSEQPWYYKLFMGADADAEALRQEMIASQRQDMLDRQQKQAQAEADAAAKRAGYSYRSNPWDYGPTGAEVAPYLMGQLLRSEQRNGLSIFNPITSTLAGSLNPASFAGAAELQRTLSQKGGGEKTLQERIAAANEAEEKRLEKIENYNREMLELQKKGIVITAPPAL